MSNTHRKPSRGRLADGSANPIDRHVGTRLRLRRTLLGLSQEKLADALGLTLQQVQKYERGANRISASRLFDVARVLDVPVSFFYDDMGDDVKAASPSAIITGAVTTITTDKFDIDPMTKRETLELARAYYSISNPSIRRRAYDLIKAMAGSEVGGAQ